MVWFAVNAQLDGVDPGSANPLERLKYVVYQRRLLVEALKTKAMLYAMLGEAEKASTAAKEYFTTAFPISKADEAVVKARKARAIDELEQMGPIKIHNGKLTAPAPLRFQSDL